MRKILLLLVAVIACTAMPPLITDSNAEYADKVLNRYATKNGMRAVVFPHWVHRIRITCKVCHQDLGFKLMLGSNDIKMADIIQGKFCGACHNGRVAWPPTHCDRCHSGAKPTDKQLPLPDTSRTTAAETAGYVGR